MINCNIISIGDELLVGQVINTNATMIASKLTEIGTYVQKNVTIPDEKEDILNALSESYDNFNITIVTGGLGPTNDDITKECACSFFDCNLVFNQDAYDRLLENFKDRKEYITKENEMQAWLPSKCIPLPNLHGTAAGMWFQSDDKKRVMVFLPGVPLETEKLLDNYVIPKLIETFDYSGVKFKTVLTYGCGETIIAGILEEWESNLPENVILAYLPDIGSVRLRVTAYGDNAKENELLVNQKALELKEILPEYFYGFDNDTLPIVIGKILNQKDLTLSISESCTGGYLSHLITSISGASNYFKGSVVAYSNEIKKAILKVPSNILEKYGAVSEETVEYMAKNVADIFNTDIGIGITGIAGPNSDNSNKKVGTVWVGIYYKGKTTTKLFNFRRNRFNNIKRSAFSSLKLLYNILNNNE